MIEFHVQSDSIPQKWQASESLPITVASKYHFTLFVHIQPRKENDMHFLSQITNWKLFWIINDKRGSAAQGTSPSPEEPNYFLSPRARWTVMLLLCVVVFALGLTIGWAGHRLHLLTTLVGAIHDVGETRRRVDKWFTSNPLSLFVLGTAVLQLLKPVRRFLAKLIDPSTIMDEVFRDFRVVKIILPTIEGARFTSQETSHTIEPPSNTPLMSFEDALAVEHIATTATDRYHTSKPLRLETEGGPRERNEPYIAIGGPSVNKASAALKKHLPKFSHDKERGIFTWDQKTYTVIRGQGVGGRSAPLEVDYGFIFVWTHPVTKVRSIHLWGGWAPGTFAAAKVFLEAEHTPVRKKFLRHISQVWGGQSRLPQDRMRDLARAGKSFVAIIRVSEINLLHCTPEILLVEEFTPEAQPYRT